MTIIRLFILSLLYYFMISLTIQEPNETKTPPPKKTTKKIK